MCHWAGLAAAFTAAGAATCLFPADAPEREVHCKSDNTEDDKIDRFHNLYTSHNTEQETDQTYEQRSDPCDCTLPDDHIQCPLVTKFPAYGRDSCHTGRI